MVESERLPEPVEDEDEDEEDDDDYTDRDEEVVVEPVLALIVSKQIGQSIFAFVCFERGYYL